MLSRHRTILGCCSLLSSVCSWSRKVNASWCVESTLLMATKWPVTRSSARCTHDSAPRPIGLPRWYLRLRIVAGSRMLLAFCFLASSSCMRRVRASSMSPSSTSASWISSIVLKLSGTSSTTCPLMSLLASISSAADCSAEITWSSEHDAPASAPAPVPTPALGALAAARNAGDRGAGRRSCMGESAARTGAGELRCAAASSAFSLAISCFSSSICRPFSDSLRMSSVSFSICWLRRACPSSSSRSLMIWCSLCWISAFFLLSMPFTCASAFTCSSLNFFSCSCFLKRSWCFFSIICFSSTILASPPPLPACALRVLISLMSCDFSICARCRSPCRSANNFSRCSLYCLSRPATRVCSSASRSLSCASASLRSWRSCCSLFRIHFGQRCMSAFTSSGLVGCATIGAEACGVRMGVEEGACRVGPGRRGLLDCGLPGSMGTRSMPELVESGEIMLCARTLWDRSRLAGRVCAAPPAVGTPSCWNSCTLRCSNSSRLIKPFLYSSISCWYCGLLAAIVCHPRNACAAVGVTGRAGSTHCGLCDAVAHTAKGLNTD
mmetsp:Transcript_52602/g.132285  ORF Transcript_52602/g.132285 Transcript_52602/m.132285 type:complete len:553 (+) Transcript_52602:1050-2708(+)